MTFVLATLAPMESLHIKPIMDPKPKPNTNLNPYPPIILNQETYHNQNHNPIPLKKIRRAIVAGANVRSPVLNKCLKSVIKVVKIRRLSCTCVQKFTVVFGIFLNGIE